MTGASNMTAHPDWQTVDNRKKCQSLLALVAYLEHSPDDGTCVVMMRKDGDRCSVYVGDFAYKPSK
jgi:hypothetical protein